MKSKITRASTTLAMLALLAASGLHGAAQQREVRRLPAEVQQERRIPVEQQQERPIIELQGEKIAPPDAGRVAVPRECARLRPDVQRHDVADNFAPPGAPLQLSPTLTSFLASRNTTPKGYDDQSVNRVFADSFRLRSCRICYATLQVRLRYTWDWWSNDTITAGVAPFNPASVRFLYSNLWNPSGPNPTAKTVTFPLSTADMNNYIMTGSMPPFLDVITQDDSDFDYATLSVWYY
ncbi:MAG TPA: hypothetical protein VF588_05980 [Pyrinomonadaceae bacterium]|jgi:hypothetical protein